MIKIIVTIVLMALLVLGIVKKYNIAMLFWTVSLIGLLFWQYYSGTSILGDKSTGNYILDIFGYYLDRFYNSMTSNLSYVLLIFGYVGYMNSINATELFAKTILRPLKKFNKPYVIGVLVVLIGTLLKLIISHSVALGATLLATVAPILIGLGFSMTTVAQMLLIPTLWVYGPSNAVSPMAFELIGVKDYTVLEMTINYELIPLIIAAAVMITVALLMSKRYDAREREGEGAQFQFSSVFDESLPDIPKIFMIFPIMPILFQVVFSDMILGIKLAVPATFLMCFVIAVVSVSIWKKSLKAGMKSASAYFEASGKALTNNGFVIIGAGIFAGVMGFVGGLGMIAEVLTGFSGNLMFAATILISAVAFFCIPAASGTAAVISPIIGAYVAATGANPIPFVVGMNSGIAYGYMFSPASAGMLFNSSTYGVPPTTLIKRNLIPGIAAMVVHIVVMYIMFF